VAGLLVDGGVLLNRVPGLVQQALVAIDDPEAFAHLDLFPESSERIAAEQRMLIADHVDALLVFSRYYEKQGQDTQAQQTLRQAEEYLDARRQAGVDRQVTRSLYERFAELAEHQGRKLDALIARRAAAVTTGSPNEASVGAQRRLWKELGGTDEGWRRWLDLFTPAQPGADRDGRPVFVKVRRPLPDFKVKDAAGAEWTRASFQGKTTVAVVWATWCGPCRTELPWVEALAELRLLAQVPHQALGVPGGQ
jgi:thiol-disulfide isomerase/thioredoxin